MTYVSTYRKILLSVLALVLAFGFQGSRGLWDPDEGRYSSVALEMVDSGDYVVPMRNDDSLHMARPPVTYWAMVASVNVFGRNEGALRLPMALSFLLTVFLVYKLGDTFLPKRPWLPALIYLGSPVPLLAASAITTDTLLVCAETAAVLAYINHRFSDQSIGWLDGMWGLFGLAFMIKGPPALLPLLPIMAWEWKHGSLKSLLRVKGLILFACIGLSWFLIIVYRYPSLLGYFLGHELIARLATTSLDLGNQWYGGFLIYLPTLILGAMPWLALSVWRRWMSVPQALPIASGFLWYWLLLPLVIFVVASSRQAFNVLPLFVPMALLIAQSLENLKPRRLHIVLISSWFIVLLATKALVAHAPSAQDARALAQSLEKVLPEKAQELVFVNTKARYGLRFYLGTEIEKISIQKLSGPHATSDATYDDDLDNELAEAEPGTYFLVPKEHLWIFTQSVSLHNRQLKRIGAVDKLEIFQVVAQ